MRNAVFTFLILISSLASFAQDAPAEERKGFQKEKLFVGGNFGLSFGDYTLINVSPQVGYRFSNFFAAGLGLNAQYVSEKFDYLNPPYKLSQGVVGLNVFGRVYPIDQIFIQAQPEANYIFGNIKFLDGRSPSTTKSNAQIIPSLLTGGGVALPSGRGAFIISVFYDLLQRPGAPYGNKPIYNFGYNVSL
jgi:hypothetical protein